MPAVPKLPPPRPTPRPRRRSEGCWNWKKPCSSLRPPIKYAQRSLLKWLSVRGVLWRTGLMVRRRKLDPRRQLFQLLDGGPDFIELLGLGQLFQPPGRQGEGVEARRPARTFEPVRDLR